MVKDQYIAGGSRKLEPRFKRPFIVTETIPNDRYRIATVPGFEGASRGFNPVYSADRLKPWCDAAVLDDALDEPDETDSAEATINEDELNCFCY